MKFFTFAALMTLGLSSLAHAESPAHQAATQDTGEKGTSGATAQKDNPQAKEHLNPVEIVSRIHAINEADMRMGAVAAQRATSPEVQAFGKELRKQHEKADQKLLSFAAQEKIQVQASQVLGGKAEAFQENRRDMLSKLQKLSGKEFDREFLSFMKDSHERSLEILSAAQRSAENDQLKKMITDMIPNVRRHHQTAITLMKALEKQPRSAE